MDWILLLEWVIKAVVLSLVLLGGFAYLTLLERRVLAWMQVRIGPNRAGWQGILQPIADAVKLIFKEEVMPPFVQKKIFILAPILTVVPAVVIAAVVPWGRTVVVFGRNINLYIADINVGLLYIGAIASIAVYGLTLAGWSSNNKFALLGGIRSSAQMISYELTLGLCFVLAIVMSGSMRLIDIVEAQRGVWFVFLQPVGAVIFFIAALAETSRAPFDMPEAEQELSAGFHTEYSGMKFALFFMAEYIKMITVSAIGATLFLGGYLGPWVDQLPWLGPLYMFLKVLFLLFLMIWVRATLPRIRYDRLMALGWKVLLPLTLGLAFASAAGILLFQETQNQLFMWAIPAVSLLMGFFVVAMIDRMLRRKLYEAG
jgi:NADH-quinone oxidoreductase subunit H